MIRTALLLACLTLPPDSIRSPYPYVESCRNQCHYAKVTPGRLDPDADAPGAVAVYAIATDGPDELLWSTTGWYSYRVMLHTDGEHLVRLGVVTAHEQPSSDDVALAFYRNGEQLRSFSTLDLVAADAPSRAMGKWHWLAGPEPAFGAAVESHLLRVTTSDRTEHVFDVRTGELVASFPDAPLVPASGYRSFRSPPPHTISRLEHLRRSWLVLLVGGLAGLAVGLGIEFLRWQKQLHSPAD